MRNPSIVLIAAALAGHLSMARAADLIQTYQQALVHDAAYASARDALAAGQEKTTQGRAGLLPVLQLNGLNGRTTTRQSSSFNASLGLPPGGPDDFLLESDSQSHQNTYTVSLAQPLYNGAAWERYEQSKLLQANAEALFVQARQELIGRVAQAYFDVLTAQDSLAATRAQKVATTEQLASAKRNFEVGTQTITDAHEAQAAYDLVLAEELAGVNDLDSKRAVLQSIIGSAPGELAPLRSGVALAAPEPAAIDPWVQAAEAHNPAVASAELGLETAKRQIAADRAGHLPTATLSANSTRAYQTPASLTRTNAIGVSWSLPLFNGFAITSKVRESIALESQARNDLELTRRRASLSARQAYFSLTSGLALVKALEAAEASSKSSLRSNKLGYQVGVRVNIDVLNAQKLLYATQKDLSKARYDTVMSGLLLKAAAGSLKEADLGEVNALLEH